MPSCNCGAQNHSEHSPHKRECAVYDKEKSDIEKILTADELWQQFGTATDVTPFGWYIIIYNVECRSWSRIEFPFKSELDARSEASKLAASGKLVLKDKTKG